MFAVLEQCWDQETAYLSCQEEWVPEDSSFGQCAITAMLVHDMFGGTIHKIRGDGGGTHYFNRLNGKYVDLTREQFDLYNLPVAYEPNQEIPREFCGRNKNTLMRYHRLQWNIMLYLGTAILQKLNIERESLYLLMSLADRLIFIFQLFCSQNRIFPKSLILLIL